MGTLGIGDLDFGDPGGGGLVPGRALGTQEGVWGPRKGMEDAGNWVWELGDPGFWGPRFCRSRTGGLAPGKGLGTPGWGLGDPGIGFGTPACGLGDPGFWGPWVLVTWVLGTRDRGFWPREGVWGPWELDLGPQNGGLGTLGIGDLGFRDPGQGARPKEGVWGPQDADLGTWVLGTRGLGTKNWGGLAPRRGLGTQDGGLGTLGIGFGDPGN